MQANNSSDAVTFDVCPDTDWLALGLFSILALCLALFATIINILFLAAILKMVNLDQNMRACLANMGVGIVLADLPAACRYSLGIIGMFKSVRPIQPVLCSLINAPAISSFAVMFSSMAGLALERWRTFQKAKAEGNHEVRVFWHGNFLINV